tara:strand:+ start:1303 stop:1926 length:624 start_codon:yes stop_codon:yes gene_type:complete
MQYLAIDTTTQEIKLALFNTQTQSKFELTEFVGRKQSEQLHVKIKEILDTANLTVADLNTIIVNLGPGSYTSLRLGIAAAKGMALPFNINVIGFDSFTILKDLYNATEKQAIVLENSERQLYLDTGYDQLIIEPSEITENLEDGQDVMGNGFETYAENLKPYNLIENTGTMTAMDLINYAIKNDIKETPLEPLYIKPLTYKKYEYKL